jgi:exodeoxyribonuclease-3
MKIATWNINGLRARLDFIQHWLDARQPDLVGLQELKTTDEDFPTATFEKAGYHSAFLGQKGWNGVAILAHEPIQAAQVGLPGQEELGARLITVDYQDLSFTTVYCPNGKSTDHDDFPRKLAWFDALLDHFEEHHDPDRATILGGDINICPAPIDSWNEEALSGRIFHTDEERLRLQRLLDWGFVDLYRSCLPESRLFSWWDYRGGSFHRNQGLRIDLLFGTQRIRERVRAIEIDRDYRKKKEGLTASDHAPVIVDLE